MIRHSMTSLALGAMLIANAPAAFAESAAQDSQHPTAATEAISELGVVVVTARRREEDLQKVPVAVTVLSGDELQRQQIISPQDLNAHVPSLTIGSTSMARDSAKYAIRGEGQPPGGFDPSVVTYFAEVPTISTGPGLLFDLDNVQVLKGPQGTLFGRATTGGAILLQPTKPGNDFGGYVNASAGSYSLRHFEGAVNVPIIPDKLLARFSADINRRDGYTKDVVNGRAYDARSYESYRFSLLARPFEGLENYTLFNYTTSDGTMGGTSLVSVNPTGLAATFFPVFNTLLAPQQARGVRRTSLSPTEDYQKIRMAGVTNITTWKLSDSLTLKNILGYRLFRFASVADIDGTALPLVDFTPNPFWGSGGLVEPSQRMTTDEFQVQGKSLQGRMNWILGAYYEKRKPEASDNKDVLTQFFQPGFVIQSLRTDSTRAVFGQTTYEVADGWKLTAGARYTSDKRSQIVSNYLGTPATCTFQLAVPNCLAISDGSFHATTWNVSVDYQATPGTLLYATARRGYKSGGFNVVAPTVAQLTYKPEYVADVELGVKSEFDWGSVPVRANIDAFRSKFTDRQIAGAVFSGGQFLNLFTNAGSGVIQGIEAEATARLFKGFTLSAFFAFTDPKYNDYDLFGVDLSKTPFNQIPKQKYGVSGTYQTSLGQNIGTLDLSATYSYQSHVYFSVPTTPIDHDPQAGQKAYGLLNLHAGLNHVGGTPFDISAFVTNATNKDFKVFEIDAYDQIGFSAAIYGEPRMIGVEARYHFGGDAK